MGDNLLEKIEQFKLPLVMAFVGIVLLIGGLVSSNSNKPKEFPKESLVQGQKLIVVDVSGAVNKPGVYKLSDGSRIEEAISQAGGFTQKANQEYISKYLNMAQKVSDGTKIYIPFTGEQTTAVQNSGSVAGVATSSKVNINTSSQSELEALSGIGPVTASKIISDRPYQEVADLLNKKVISKALFEKLKDSLVVY